MEIYILNWKCCALFLLLMSKTESWSEIDVFMEFCKNKHYIQGAFCNYTPLTQLENISISVFFPIPRRPLSSPNLENCYPLYTTLTSDRRHPVEDILWKAFHNIPLSDFKGLETCISKYNFCFPLNMEYVKWYLHLQRFRTRKIYITRYFYLLIIKAVSLIRRGYQ